MGKKGDVKNDDQGGGGEDKSKKGDDSGLGDETWRRGCQGRRRKMKKGRAA